jgi:hypothetical protein
MMFGNQLLQDTPLQRKKKTATKKELKRNNKIAMDFILEGLPDPVREKWENVHQLKNFGISYIISTLKNLPSQSQRMLKKCKYRTRRNMLIMSDRFRRRRL